MGWGLPCSKVAAGEVRIEQVQQGHSLLNEVVRQTPPSREDIERVALQEFVGVFQRGRRQLEAGELDRQRRASGKA
jgi:hypothetical protein